MVTAQHRGADAASGAAADVVTKIEKFVAVQNAASRATRETIVAPVFPRSKRAQSKELRQQFSTAHPSTHAGTGVSTPR